MNCAACGAELAEGFSFCPKCGQPVSGPSSSGSVDSIDRLVDEAAKTAKELTAAAARLSTRILNKTEAVLSDPPGAAKKAGKRVVKEFRRAKDEIERVLKHVD